MYVTYTIEIFKFNIFVITRSNLTWFSFRCLQFIILVQNFRLIKGPLKQTKTETDWCMFDQKVACLFIKGL